MLRVSEGNGGNDRTLVTDAHACSTPDGSQSLTGGVIHGYFDPYASRNRDCQPIESTRSGRLDVWVSRPNGARRDGGSVWSLDASDSTSSLLFTSDPNV